MAETRALILSAADDLDRLEELESRPGRVGEANRLRRFASSWRLRSDFLVFPHCSTCDDSGWVPDPKREYPGDPCPDCGGK
jgi:hypothetical protein